MSEKIPSGPNPGSASALYHNKMIYITLSTIFSPSYVTVETKEGNDTYTQLNKLILAVADLGGRPPTAQNFLNFMQFFAKFGKIICLRPPKGWRPLLRGILDPPLIRAQEFVSVIFALIHIFCCSNKQSIKQDEIGFCLSFSWDLSTLNMGFLKLVLNLVHIVKNCNANGRSS